MGTPDLREAWLELNLASITFGPALYIFVEILRLSKVSTFEQTLSASRTTIYFNFLSNQVMITVIGTSHLKQRL